MSARIADDRWFRILTVVDQFTRECLCLVAVQSLTGEQVTQAVEPVVCERGTPRSITVDSVLYPDVRSHKRKNFRSAALGSCETIPLLPSQWASTS